MGLKVLNVVFVWLGRRQRLPNERCASYRVPPWVAKNPNQHPKTPAYEIPEQHWQYLLPAIFTETDTPRDKSRYFL